MHDSCIRKCTYSHAVKFLNMKRISSMSLIYSIFRDHYISLQANIWRKERLEENTNFLEVIQLIQTNRLKYKFLPTAMNKPWKDFDEQPQNKQKPE